jgi:hypothetical protein
MIIKKIEEKRLLINPKKTIQRKMKKYNIVEDEKRSEYLISTENEKGKRREREINDVVREEDKASSVLIIVF